VSLFIDISTGSSIEEVDDDFLFEYLIEESVFSNPEPVGIWESGENLYIEIIFVGIECENSEGIGEARDDILSSVLF